MDLNPEELKELLGDLLDRAKEVEHQAEETMESAGSLVQDLENFISETFACNQIVNDPAIETLPQRCLLPKGHSEPCESKLQRMKAKLAKMTQDLRDQGIRIESPTGRNPTEPAKQELPKHCGSSFCQTGVYETGGQSCLCRCEICSKGGQ